MNIKNLQEVLTILIPHLTDPTKEWVSADHDIIFFPNLDIPLSDEELKKVEELGCHMDEDNNCLATFV